MMVTKITFRGDPGLRPIPTDTLALQQVGGGNLFYSVKDLAKMLSLSERQVNLRIDQMSTLLDGHIRRGSRGKRMLDQNGFTLLKRVVQIEREKGISSKLAVEQVKEELEESKSLPSRDHVEVGQTDVMVAMFRETIDMLKRELEAKEKEIERLHNLLSRQLPPPPRRRRTAPDSPWWKRLFRRGKPENAQ